MTNELATINQDELDQFNNAAGTSSEDLSGGGGNFVPQLKLNYNEEDDKGRTIKKGKFFITNQDEPVYADEVTIRPLMQHFQWVKYVEAEKKVTNKTIFIVDIYKDEARDELGTVRCGKPPSKTLKDNPNLAAQYEDVTAYRNIHVLVSYTGETADGTSVTVENVVAVIRNKGSNFLEFDTDFIKKMPKGSHIYDFNVKVTAEKQKKGTLIYYLMRYDADWQNKVRLDFPTFETAKALQKRVEEFNDGVDKKYYNAKKSLADDTAAGDAIDGVLSGKSLENDFNDDDKIPF